MTPDVASAPDGESSALAAAGRAVALCCRGEVDKGLALYKQILAAKDERGARSRLPVGLHLRILRDARLDEVAAVISGEAVATGQNVNVAAALNKSPADIADEYRALFAQGAINSTMVADYLLQLSRLGETKELRSFADPEHVVRRTAISIAGESAAPENYWNDLTGWLLARRTDANWHADVQSVRDMHHIRLNGHDDPRIRNLLQALREQAAHYLVALRASIPRVQAWLPDEFRLNAWALISSGYGYNVPHMHPKGCATGVLYVSGPDEMGPDGYPAGALRIGAPPAAGDSADWPSAAVAPRPGTLVLLPSYLTHWTTPLGRPGLRISVAFDVIDSRAF